MSRLRQVCPACDGDRLIVRLPAAFRWCGRLQAVGPGALAATEFPVDNDALVICECDWTGKVSELKNIYSEKELIGCLIDLITTVNETGGIRISADGTCAPNCDSDWVDLGEAYMRACAAIGDEPQIVEEDES